MRMNKIIANEALLSEVCSLLAVGKQVRLAAKGNSMRPFINGATDVLVLAPAMRAGAGLWMWLLPVRRFLLPLVAKRHSS